MQTQMSLKYYHNFKELSALSLKQSIIATGERLRNLFCFLFYLKDTMMIDRGHNRRKRWMENLPSTYSLLKYL